MNLVSENTSRKIDSCGRVVIPKSIRDRYSIRENDELQFFTLQEDGLSYICLSNGKTVDPKYQAAANVLNELGIDIPQELQDILDNYQV